MRTYNLKYGELLDVIRSFENTGVLYSHDIVDGELIFNELPPTKRGFEINLMSVIISFPFDYDLSHLPRKKKRKVNHHFKKHIKKLRREIKRMYDESN